MSKSKKRPKPPSEARFRVGDRVRVRHGVRDEDYPDMPMGGWAGEIAGVHDNQIVAVRWNRQTLDAMHPVFKGRCEKDGVELETYYLEDGDLEPDPGGPLQIEQPTEIKTRPLDPNDQDDRVRMALRLTSNDPLPDVDGRTLAVYHRHLSQKLTFPFEAEYSEEVGPFEDKWYSVKVTKLLDPDDCDEMYGLFCEGRSGRRKVELPLGEFQADEDDPELQPLADYCYWFWNHR